MPQFTQLFVHIQEAWADLDDKSILNELRKFGPLIDIRRPNPSIAFVTMTEENKNSALQREARADLPSWMTVARAHNPRPTNPSVYIDRNENNVCRAHLLGHCGDGENCILDLQHPWYRLDVDYDEILYGKKTKKINFDEQEQSREATSSTVINHDLVGPTSTVIITPNASSEQEQEQSREATSSTVINHDLVGPTSTDNDSIDSTGGDESIEEVVSSSSSSQRQDNPAAHEASSSSTLALVIESFTDGKHDVIPLFKNGSGGDCFQYAGLQFRADDVYRLPLECLRFGQDANERTREWEFNGYVATLPKELLKRHSSTVINHDLVGPTSTVIITPNASDNDSMDSTGSSVDITDESVEDAIADEEILEVGTGDANELFGSDTNWTNLRCCSVYSSCGHTFSPSKEPDSLDSTGSSVDITDESVEDAIADEIAFLKTQWKKRDRHLPKRKAPPPESGISLEHLEKLRAATIRELDHLKEACPDAVAYFSELVKIVVPGDIIFLILLHCALQWSRGHISFNCGSGSALGDDVELGAFGNCSLDGLMGLSPFFEQFSSIDMGPVAGGFVGVNGRQGYCPTETMEYAPCPALQANETSPEAILKILSISLRHFANVKALAYMFSAAGTTTGVNKRILHPLAKSFNDSKFITIDDNALNHVQFFRRKFQHGTLMTTCQAMSDKLVKVSDCLSTHLKIKCDIALDESKSLYNFACRSSALPMINDDPSEESLQKLVKVSKEEGENPLGLILFHCRRNKSGLAKDGPGCVKRYAFQHFPEIKAREEEYNKWSGHDLVPARPDEVTCFHILSNMGVNSWVSKSDQEKKECIAAMRNARRKRKKTDDESDDVIRDASGDVREGRTRRAKKICSAEDCDNQAKKGGVCIRHGAKTAICSEEDCDNQVVKGGVCMRHGAKKAKKICSEEDCDNQVVKGGVCVRHGAKKAKKICSEEDCDNQVVKGGVCIRHGAKTAICSEEDCDNQVVKGGVCMRHGAKKAKKICSEEDCDNQVVKGGVCVRHGAKKAICSEEDCDNQAQKGGVCMRHGAKVAKKICSEEDCDNQAQKGGVCMRHGAKVAKKICSEEDCDNQVVKGGVCIRHGAKTL